MALALIFPIVYDGLLVVVELVMGLVVVSRILPKIVDVSEGSGVVLGTEEEDFIWPMVKLI